MANSAQPANFDGAKPVIDPANAAMLLIDHQSGLFQTVADMPMPTLRAHATALAKMAALLDLPVITTASVPQGPNGPLIPEIHQAAPKATYVARRGEISEQQRGYRNLARTDRGHAGDGALPCAGRHAFRARPDGDSGHRFGARSRHRCDDAFRHDPA